MKKQKIRSYIHYLSRFIVVISMLLLAKNVYKSFTYSEIYEKSPEEIAAQSDVGSAWGVTVVTLQDHEITAKLRGLNGCHPIETVNFTDKTTIFLSGITRKGNAKVMLLDKNHDIAAFTTVSDDQEDFVIEPGEYQIVAVGLWYSGKIILQR